MRSRSKSPPRIEAPKSLNVDPQISHRHFPCKQCGAALAYSAAAKTLVCPYCGTENRIPKSTESIEELDFRATLARLADEEPVQTAQITHCDHCGAEVAFDEHVHSGECPFCGNPVVTTPSRQRHIQPRSLLPFSVSRKDARTAFRGWLKGLWFAPGSLTRHARSETKLAGVYVPYWTYDCETATTYQGQRGEAYQVPQTYSTIEKGRRVIRTRLVTRIRWTPVSGKVLRNFDDILVIASRSLPRQITERLEPWDLDNLVPYREEYLSGFRSEMYQIDLSKGFEQAREIMAGIINHDIARDIGGDFQKISSANTRFGDIRFKHLLLPVWLATFRFHSKSYRFVVNGRTGRVQGERPWSILKLTFAIAAVLVLVLMLVFLMSYYGQIQGP